jgi:hypothetical protein
MPFLIIIDYKVLEYFTEKKILNDRQIGWTELLSNFSYKITYRPGKQNVLADTLTRKLEDLKTQKAIRDASRTGQLLPDETLAVPAESKSPAVTVAVVTRSRARRDQEKSSPTTVDESTVTDNSETASTPQDTPKHEPSPHMTDIPPAAPITQEALPPQVAAGEEDKLQGFELIDAILKANRESRNDPEARAFWRKARGKEDGWDIRLGLLVKDNKLFVPVSEKNLRTHLIDEIHSRMPTAHPGREKTK